MKAKKLPSTLLRYSLVAGASLIIGFMSFGSMYSLLPLLPLAVVTFIWAVVYEGEIFSQNLRNTFKKLFQKDYLERHLGKQFLARLYQKQHALFEEGNASDCADTPEFFRDYGRALKSLEAFAHQPLNSADKARKAFIKRTLRDMEYWFAKQLFTAPRALADDDDEAEDSAFLRYRHYMQAFLESNKQKKWQNTFSRRQKMYYATVAFCILVAGFTGLGTTWLLMEAFSILPFLAGISGPLLPALIIPMSVFAGIAYGLLTYNNVTDMINNKTVQRWYKKVVEAFQKPSWKGAILVISALLMSALAVTLTAFTAGTWWTVAKTATPLFSAMRHIPTIVIGLFTGLGALFFNLENTSETLGMLEDAMPEKGNPIQWMWRFIKDTAYEKWELLKKTVREETWGQLLNPARALLLVSGLPSRLASFIVHMLSMGLGDARTPGVPMAISGAFNVVGEAPELHMFFSTHDCGHDHDHDHGCDLHLMSQLPEHLELYKNAYIFVNNDDVKNLYYIKASGEYEAVKIDDFSLFIEKINRLKACDQVILPLDPAKIRDIITSNGGHAPSREEGSLVVDIICRQGQTLQQLVAGLDFTVNAFLVTARNELIIPIAESVDDFNDRVLRTIVPYEESMQTDPSRIFRQIRLTNQLRWNFDAATEPTACKVGHLLSRLEFFVFLKHFCKCFLNNRDVAYKNLQDFLRLELLEKLFSAKSLNHPLSQSLKAFIESTFWQILDGPEDDRHVEMLALFSLAMMRNVTETKEVMAQWMKHSVPEQQQYRIGRMAKLLSERIQRYGNMLYQQKAFPMNPMAPDFELHTPAPCEAMTPKPGTRLSRKDWPELTTMRSRFFSHAETSSSSAWSARASSSSQQAPLMLKEEKKLAYV